MKKIEQFEGSEHFFLSNFYPCGINYMGKVYVSVEHAFQAAKCKNAEDHDKVAGAEDPGEAKRLGRLFPMREDWEQVKDQIMLRLVLIKFLFDSLVATGDAELIEGNWWGDHYWGVCNGTGQNKLGIILMKVRELVR